MTRSTRPTGITLANQDYANGDTPRFDLVILTAANIVQAAGYRAQLPRRKVEDGSGWDLPCARKAMVVADPKGKRAGSGIATFIALYEAARYFATLSPKARTLREVFAGRRVLILHSGGDSRRLPAYAAIGKIFVPLPVENVHGDPRTVFDLVLEDFARLDAGELNTGSITIAAGDVMLNLAKTGIDLRPVPGHVVGVAARASMEQGSRHGVFVTGSTNKTGDTRVRTFLQKPSESQARAAGAINKDGTVAIDTGVVLLDSDTAAAWLNSLGASIPKSTTRNKTIRATGTLGAMCRATAGSIDLYEHILPMLAGNTEAVSKLDRKFGEALTKALAPNVKHFLVRHARGATFYHIGSTRELLDIGTATVFNAGRQSPPRFEPAATVVGSDVGTLTLEGPVWIEGCQWGEVGSEPAKLGGFNVITGWPKEAGIPKLESGECAAWIPVGEKTWACLAYSLFDDWKEPLCDENLVIPESWPYGMAARKHYLSAVVAHCVSRSIWNANDIWPGTALAKDRSLYTARIWPIGAISEIYPLPAAYCYYGLTMSEIDRPESDLLENTIKDKYIEWRTRVLQVLTSPIGRKRLSLQQLVGMVNHQRLADQAANSRRQGLIDHQEVRLHTDSRLDLAREGLLRRDRPPTRNRASDLRPTLFTHRECPIIRIKQRRIRELQLPYHPLEEYELHDIATIGDSRQIAVSSLLRENQLEHTGCTSAPPSLIHVSAPIRIDLAGGWTDTPPICQEHGGTVINLAVNLDSAAPITVTASHSPQDGFQIEGIVDGQTHSCTLDTFPRDNTVPAWAKLVPAASRATELSFRDRDKFPGLSLSFSSSVPKGSGLGTSSILSAALCAACYALQGKYSPDLLTKHAIAAATLCVEHAIGSGGGWQDQYGALFPGLKSLHTSAGSIQHAECTPLTIGPCLADTFASRTLLYFTGQQRLAANILQNFVNRYLDGDAPTWRTLDRLRKNVVDVREAIDRDDPTAFARHITMYWLLKRSIDPSTTNAALNRLVARVTPHLDGYLFPGAGGGGFLFMIARTTATAKTLRRDLTNHPPAPTARFYDWSVANKPLTVTVS
ncbi:MAG: hypothetical protein KGS45_10705 [Planctomycetes bacterium]|nr:hypothetical protein [Planctomycetota bacterium]